MIQIEVLKSSKNHLRLICMENGDTFGIISYQIISQNAECQKKKEEKKKSGMHMQKNLNYT